MGRGGNYGSGRRGEMPAIEVRRWTRQEYEKMVAADLFQPGERVELIDGEILRMVPQNSSHAVAVSLAHDALRAAFGPGFTVRSQMPLSLGADSMPEPDIAVVAGLARGYLHSHPSSALLVLEVADSTLDYDRRRKSALYARAGIDEYWIVNLVDRCLEVRRSPSSAGYRSTQQYEAGQQVTPLSATAASIPVSDLLP